MDNGVVLVAILVAVLGIFIGYFIGVWLTAAFGLGKSVVPGWVRVGEAFPDKLKQVMVYHPGTEYGMLVWMDEEKFWDSHLYERLVSAGAYWTYLPGDSNG